MSYDRSTLRKSEAAYTIMRTLREEERNGEGEGMYAKQIAEKSDQSRHTVSNYLKSLRDHGLIVRTKRTKAQFYGINYSGIYQFLQGEWKLIFENSKLTSGDEKLVEGLKNIREILGRKLYPDLDDEIILIEEKLITNYIKRYLDSIEDSHIENMLIHDFLSGARMSKSLINYDVKNEDINTYKGWKLNFFKLQFFLMEILYEGYYSKGTQIFVSSFYSYLDLDEEEREDENSGKRIKDKLEELDRSISKKIEEKPEKQMLEADVNVICPNCGSEGDFKDGVLAGDIICEECGSVVELETQEDMKERNSKKSRFES